MYEKRYSNNADSERVKLESDVEDSYDIYPHPTVRVVRPSRGLGHGSWKETLSDLTRRKAFLGGLAVLVFILLLSIVIILMAQSRGDDDVKPFSPEDPSTFGLHSYPSTPSGKEISFKQDILKTYQPWMDQLEKALALYSPDLQKDGYNHCDLRDRKDGEQCYFHISDLGSECQHGKEFGYSTGRPCVLLQLFLPYRPGNVAKDSDSWKTLFGALGTKWNPAFVSVTCDGKTDLDKKYITTSSNDSDVIYSPALGFRANFFPSSFDDPKYLAPLIMVQFRSLRIHHSVTVECIAWAQNKDGILPNKEELYRTEFTLRKD